MAYPAAKIRRIPVRDKAGKVSVIHKTRDKGALHDLLLKACPPDSRNVKSIEVLARHLGITPWAIQKWCNKNRLSGLRARQIVDLSKGTVALREFDAFVYA